MNQQIKELMLNWPDNLCTIMELNSKNYPATVKEKTGCSWEKWFAFLDKGKCDTMNHKEIVAFIVKNRPVSTWWCQMVTVGYEKYKGMRINHERPDGFEISVSKTIEKSADAFVAKGNEFK